MVETANEKPRVTHKVFSYQTNIFWLGGRAGLNRSSGKEAFRVASPPEFKGEDGVWTPEDLFVAAVNACTMTTFAAFAEKRKLPVVGYESAAEGTLEYADGSYRFTKIVVRPRVVLAEPATEADALAVLHDAHARCIISNSISAPVTMEPEVEIVVA